MEKKSRTGHGFLDAIVEGLEELMYEAVCSDDERSVVMEHDSDAGMASVSVDASGDVLAMVYHYDTGEEYPADWLAAAVRPWLPSWDDVEDEARENSMSVWERNGFRDAADFWRWKEG